MRDILDLINEMSEEEGNIELHDEFDIELSEDTVIESGVIDINEDGILIEGDDFSLQLLEEHGFVLEETDWSKYDEPTVSRIAKGKTKPVDRTDYDTPPAMRDPNQGKPGFEKRRNKIMKGLEKANESEDNESYNDMDDNELIRIAKQMGIEKFIIKDTHGGLVNREEVIDALKSELEEAKYQGRKKKLDEKMVIGLPGDQGSKVMGEEEVDEGLDHDYFDDQATYKYALQIADAIKKNTGATVAINTGREAGHERGTYQIVVNPRPDNRLKGFLPDGDHGATPQNLTKAIEQWFRGFRSKGWRFDQPVQGQFVIGVPNGVQHDKLDEVEMDEAKYQGREVQLGKKMKGDVKKSKVYVRKPNGKVVKVNFGDKNMRIKKSNPKRRKSFRARHNCKNPGPRWKARYWSCRSW